MKCGNAMKFVRGIIMGYVEEKNKYKFQFKDENGKEKALLIPRIYICSDLEDPSRYCEKFSRAYFCRIYADNLIKFNYYVKSMPTEGLNRI
jgi:dynein heavy chain